MHWDGCDIWGQVHYTQNLQHAKREKVRNKNAQQRLE